MDVMRVEGAELPRSSPSETVPRKVYAKVRARVEFLKSHAGEWCRLIEAPIGDQKARMRLWQRRCRYAAHHAFAGCEFASRTIDGKAILFGRFTGEPKAEVA